MKVLNYDALWSVIETLLMSLAIGLCIEGGEYGIAAFFFCVKLFADVELVGMKIDRSKDGGGK